MSGVAHRPELTHAAGHPRHHAARSAAGRLLRVLVLLGGFGTLIVVGHDGSAFWIVVRILLVLAVTAAAVIAVRHRSRWLRSLTAFGFGLITAAIGTGIGLPYLTKTGLSVLTVAGLFCLLSGLGLMVGGVAMRWPGLRVPSRAGLVVAAVALFYVCESSLGQAVAATNVPRTDVGRGVPAARGVGYTDVSFTTADGVTLSGWYLPHPPSYAKMAAPLAPAGASVMLLHGSGSTRSAVLDQALMLNRHGFAVLLFDARGHGRSGGRAMDFGWYGDLDASAAVSFLSGQPGLDPARITAVGLSMGGEEAIGAAATDHRIQAVVAEGASTRIAADRGWLDQVYGLRGRLQESVDWLTYALTDRLTAAHPPIALHTAVLATAPRPVLLITAGRDPDEAHAARFIQRGSSGSVTIWTVAGADHTGGWAAQPIAWESRVVTFLIQALSNTPS